jgi:hypothetical protein
MCRASCLLHTVQSGSLGLGASGCRSNTMLPRAAACYVFSVNRPCTLSARHLPATHLCRVTLQCMPCVVCSVSESTQCVVCDVFVSHWQPVVCHLLVAKLTHAQTSVQTWAALVTLDCIVLSWPTGQRVGAWLALDRGVCERACCPCACAAAAARVAVMSRIVLRFVCALEL